MTKTCNSCGITKPLTEFHRRHDSRDGHQGHCKLCQKERSVAWRLANLERYAAVRAEWRKNNPDKMRELKRAWNKAHPDRIAAKIARQKKNNPARTSAHLAVKSAIRSGALVRQPCEVCGDLSVEAHHDDYRQPLAVRWLCPAHHTEHHTQPLLLTNVRPGV